MEEGRVSFAECIECGIYTRCDHHHVNPNLKNQNVSNLRGRKRIDEALLCVRMCAMCHREHHAGTGTRRHVGHGKARGTSTPLISRNPKKRPNSDRLGGDDGGVGLDDDEAEGHMWRMP